MQLQIRLRRTGATLPVGRRGSTRIGLISDTHGVLRDEALAFLRGADAIVHGGDIGDASVLDALSAIAPVTAVRGNNDTAAWADALAKCEVIEFGALRLLAIHDRAQLGGHALPDPIDVVVSGHSHRPSITQEDSRLHINPGSAGRRRFSLPLSVAELIVEGDLLTARIVELQVAGGR